MTSLTASHPASWYQLGTRLVLEVLQYKQLEWEKMPAVGVAHSEQVSFVHKLKGGVDFVFVSANHDTALGSNHFSSYLLNIILSATERNVHNQTQTHVYSICKTDVYKLFVVCCVFYIYRQSHEPSDVLYFTSNCQQTHWLAMTADNNTSYTVHSHYLSVDSGQWHLSCQTNNHATTLTSIKYHLPHKLFFDFMTERAMLCGVHPQQIHHWWHDVCIVTDESNTVNYCCCCTDAGPPTVFDVWLTGLGYLNGRPRLHT